VRALLRVCGACVATAMLGACVGEGPVHESRIEARLPAKVAPIVVGQTDRAAVRQALGKPWLASEYWGLDVFRIADSNVNMVMILIPVWLSTDETKGYVLVTYDASSKVTGYGKDIASEGSLLAGTVDQGAAVFAGDVRFAVSGGRDEALVAVASARRDEYLHSHPPTDLRKRDVAGAAGAVGRRGQVWTAARWVERRYQTFEIWRVRECGCRAPANFEQCSPRNARLNLKRTCEGNDLSDAALRY
jgi:hypothetical protein